MDGLEQKDLLFPDLLESYPRRLAFWGVGPSGPGYSNFWIRVWFEGTLGCTTGPRPRWWLLRLARRIPPGGILEELVGYSRGVVTAVRLARILESRRVTIREFLALDPIVFHGRCLCVPENVIRATCYYQRNGARTLGLWGRLGRGVPLARRGGGGNELVNVLLTTDCNGRRILHEDVPSYVWHHLREQGFPKEASTGFLEIEKER
ncbi:hypothetical protein [Candidatus Methylacidithermus pantelleriae]|uniref:Uncharacterized protein n=1 Tax=Candidatus Methylacidithermus pantelleriae TaxID=2744239 RepID=A0A8J2FTT2_9BACT|nr:hypothetical protein [Candidatus Methylacidithermus pantelleriae]CAF0704492.1 hypothetical protein MPNT_70043 [Candidatus Methylacidithermus pantelleriae]